MLSLALSNVLTQVRRERYVWTGNADYERRRLLLVLRPAGVCGLELKAWTGPSFQLFRLQSKTLPRVRGDDT